MLCRTAHTARIALVCALLLSATLTFFASPALDAPVEAASAETLRSGLTLASRGYIDVAGSKLWDAPRELSSPVSRAG